MDGLVQLLEERFGKDADGLRMHLDGCPHACAHHWVGELGFQGTTVRDDEGRRRQAYDVYPARQPRPSRGDRARRCSSASRPRSSTTPSSASSAAGSAARADGETFRTFCDRTTDDDLGRLAGREPAKAEGEGMSVELLDDLEAGELASSSRERSRRSCSSGRSSGSRRRSRSRPRSRPTARCCCTWRTRSTRRSACSASTRGACPSETFELIEQMRDRYPRLQLDLLSPEGAAGQRDGRQARAEPLLQERREPAALLPGAEGAAAAAAPRRARRVDHRPASRPVGDAQRHPQGRDRPRPRRDREAQPARGVVGGRGLGLRARARPSVQLALRQGLHVDRLRAVHAADAGGRGPARRPLVVGDERAEGVRHPLRDRDGRSRARAARADRRRRDE